MDKEYVVRVLYYDTAREEELLGRPKPIVATSFADAERQAVRWVEKNRKVPRREFRVTAIRWDKQGVSPALKDRR